MPGAENELSITANATFCATLIDEWISRGITGAFIAPGSRSTPLALALADRSELRIEIAHDERVASFAALGHGLATGTPAVVICSSGTAGAHFLAAVIEADLSAVPLLVCTADRPPELWGRGAPQVIDQTDLYGETVRAFIEPGPPDDVDPEVWREIAAVAYSAATGQQPGPVHLNLSFRDPLTGRPGELPPALVKQAPVDAEPNHVEIDELVTLLDESTGLIVAGRGQTDPIDVARLSARLGWPVIADHRSGCRSGDALRHFDAILREPSFASAQHPDVILRLGEIVSSKATSQWISATAAQGTTIVAARPWGRLVDPEDVATFTPGEHGLVDALIKGLGSGTPSDLALEHASRWKAADQVAVSAIDGVLAREAQSEPGIARTVVASIPAQGALLVASSMPVRDLEWYGPNRDDIMVCSNRGANGIDGTVATAIGIASTGRPTTVLVGDVAFLHDSTALIALGSRALNLTIVVTDNDGGGIFSFLPQHTLLPDERYEPLFGTPHGTDIAALCRAHGLRTQVWAPGTTPALTPDGIRVVVATTDRNENLALHNELNRSVAEALGAS